MNGAVLNFDATNVPVAQAFDVIPSGWQNVAITASEIKPTKDGTGQYLWLELTVLDGPYAQRKVFDQLNIVNTNAQTVEIAYKTLSAICHAVGLLQVGNSAELHGKPMKVKLKKQDARKDAATGREYDANNEVKGYDHVNSDHAVEHTPRAAGVAGAPQGVPVWAAGGAPSGAPTAPAPAPAAPAMGMQPPGTPPALATQPWAQPQAPGTVPPAPVAAPPAPVAANPLQTANADGWQPHPSAPGYWYKGQEVKTEAEVAAMYSVPSAPPAPMGIPAAPSFTPPVAAAPTAGIQAAPWLQK